MIRSSGLSWEIKPMMTVDLPALTLPPEVIFTPLVGEGCESCEDCWFMSLSYPDVPSM